MASSPEAIAADVQALRDAFYSGVTRDVAARKQQLRALQRMLNENIDAFCDAMWKDLHKHPSEVKVMELGTVHVELQEHLDYIDDWCQPERVPTNFANLPGRARVYKEPLGVVNIIATWNYPLQLTLQPLVGAISAGNTVLLRLPGDDTCVHTNELLATLLAKYMDDRVVRTVRGGVDASRAMLAERFDLIFCTGGEFIGRIVAEAAAKHLTPTVLELGGKSPCIVDASCDVAIAARRITWGAFLNAGQTCVRPDYLLVDASIGDVLVAAIETEITRFFGNNAQLSDSFGRIVNDRSFDKLQALLTTDRAHVTFGGATDAKDRFIGPTLLNFKADKTAFQASAAMTAEVFGPVLPILYYNKLNDALAIVKSHANPLALYVFTTCAEVRERVLTHTSSGGVSVNDTIVHVSNPSLPFGGVGSSGMGAYHGRASFETFSHRKGVQIKYNVLDAKQRYQPYSKTNDAVLMLLLKPIPRRVGQIVQCVAVAAAVAIVSVLVQRLGWLQ